MLALTLLAGAAVGIALGLTGGGGSILAVPMLVYLIGLPAQQAVVVSLAAVGVIALIGAGQRLAQGEIDWRAGLVFAIAGMVGAPLGTWLSHGLSESLLLGLFAILMVVVAARMWIKAGTVDAAEEVPDTRTEAVAAARRSCQKPDAGRIRLTRPCLLAITGAGLATGVLAGLFGVGGGFLIVPALIMVSAMPIHRAVATSLGVIALISVAGVASHLITGQTLNWAVTGLFVVGGLGGIWGGGQLARRLPARRLQRVFSGLIVAVAIMIAIQVVL